jgi:transposase
MVTDQLDAVIGVDTHRDTHSAAVLRPTGAMVATTVIDTTGSGYQALLDFVLAHAPGPRLLWAVEGTRSYGIGLARFLHAGGQVVVEVDHPRRPARRRGKSDAIDAIGAAREVLARPHQAIPRQDGNREGLRVLLVARASAVTSRTAAINSLKALVLTAPDPIRDQLRGKPAMTQAASCARLRRSPHRRPYDQARMLALRATARRVLALAGEVDELETELAVLVRRWAPQLLAHKGVGVVVAAQLLVSWSHHGRVRSEAAFAMLAGVAPLPASSGTVVRHRLNRSGDRALNRALHLAVLSRMAHDPETKAYVARRLAEGKTKPEVRRCIKRHLARRLYRAMQALPDDT